MGGNSGDSGEGANQPEGAGSELRAWQRLLLSVALALIPLLGRLVPMPGADFASEVQERDSGSTTSVVALGVSPLLSAYFIVELAALIVPRWGRLRHGMPEGRRKLNRAVVTTALILAAFQALAIAMMLEAGELATDVNRLLVIASLVGATCVMVLVASQIDRLGVINGVVALWVVEGVSKLVPQLPKIVVPTHALAALALVLALVVPIAATWLAARAFASSGERVKLSIPAGSLSPVPVAAALLALPAALLGLELPLDGALDEIVELATGRFHLEAGILIAIPLAAIFSLLLQRPAVVRATLGSIDPERAAPNAGEVWQALRYAILPTLAFTLALIGCDHVATEVGLPTPLSPLLAIGTALVIDGLGAFRLYASAPDLICVAEERRPYALPAMLAAAAREGVSLQVSGIAMVSLLRLFAPFSAIRLSCAPADADKARQVLGKLFAQRAAKPEKVVAEPAAAPAAVRPSNAVKALTTLGIAVAVLLLWMRVGAFPLFAREVATTTLRGIFEVSRVDDDANPFDIKAKDLPAGVAILEEYVSVKQPVRRSFVRVVLQGTETFDEARWRIATWLARAALPAGRRVAWGEVTEDGPVSRDSNGDLVEGVTGYRTYLLVGDPILTTADLADASLNQDAERRYFVGLRLNPEGTERFRSATSRHVGERIAIAVDGIIRSVPVVQSEISGGYVQISMGAGLDPEGSKAEAERLYRKIQGN